MARRIIKNNSDLDFSNINKSMPTESPLLKNSKEKSEAEEENQKEETFAEVVSLEIKGEGDIKENENGKTPVDEAKEITTSEVSKEETSESSEKKKKRSKKNVEVKTADDAEETENVEEPEKVKDFSEFPEFYEIIYNDYDTDRAQITLTLDKINLEKLDAVTDVLPKGQKSSRGQILSNLLTFFFGKYEKEVNAMLVLKKMSEKKKK